MQSKGKKALLFVLLLLAGALIAAFLHEPELKQTEVEQVLDATHFRR